jgi:hypothetical protein
MNRRTLTIPLLVLGLGFLLARPASAQGFGPDVLKINYFANNVAGAPDATVRIDNPGTDATANLCALIYVFDNDQQLSECCGCLVTANGLRTLSVKNNLTSNPLTGVVSNNGMIMIVSSAVYPNGVPCDPTFNIGPTPSIRAWATHVQNKVGTAYPITETEFSDATLNGLELDDNLGEQCSFAHRLGSGQAVCSCGTGD